MDTNIPELAALKKLHETQATSGFSKQPHQKSIEIQPNTTRKGVFISSSKTRRRSTSHITEDNESLLVTNNLTEIERILRAEDRDEDSAKKLYEHIRHFSFFEAINTKFPGTHFDDEGFIQLCAKLKYEKVTANKVLFQEGDSTNGRVYFIYSGQVNLYKKSAETVTLHTEQPHSQIFSLKTIDSASMRKVTLDLSQQSARPLLKGKHQTVVLRSEKSLFDDKLEELDKYGQADAELRTGQFFGEQALIDWEQRQFTAVTNETCELLVLTRRDFKFLRENYDEKRKKVCAFLEEYVPQMSNVNTWQLLDELICVIQEKTFERGTFIINEGEASDTFFIVFDGTCELIKNVRVDESANLKDTLVSIKQLLRVAPSYTEQLPICTVQKGTFLGDEVVFGPDRTYNFSVRVTSGFATMFIIEKTKFIQKFPLIVREEVAKLFQTKKKHYARAVRTSLSKKYANMEANVSRPSTSAKTADERLLSSPIILIPRKGGDMHFKARSGVFRADKNETSDILGRVSPEATRRVMEDAVGEGSPRKSLKSVNNSEIGGMSPGRMSILGHLVNRPNSDNVNKEEEGMESPRKNLLNGVINVKEKVCRLQVQTDHPKDNSYVSTSPLPKTKTLTNRSIAVRKILLAAGSSSNNTRGATDRKSYDRFLESGEVTAREEPETADFSDYGKLGTSKDSTYVDKVGTKEQPSRAVSVGKFHRAALPKVMHMDSFEKIEKGKVNEEMQNTLFEIRTMLMEKDSKSREFIMTRKRLESKYLNQRPPKVETERDGSLGKRLDVLLKPMREKTAGGLGHVKTLSEININTSPSPAKRTNIHIPLISDNSFITASGSATRRGNRIKFGTEIIANNYGSDYLDNSADKSPLLLTNGKPHHFNVVTADSQRKARNDRQMALLRAKFKTFKNTDSSYELPQQKNLGIQLRIQPVTSRGEANSVERFNGTLSSRRPKV